MKTLSYMAPAIGYTLLLLGSAIIAGYPVTATVMLVTGAGLARKCMDNVS